MPWISTWPCAATVAGADGVLWRYADPEEQAAVIRRAASGEQQFPNLQPSEIHALLDQVEDRDRAIVAMLMEHTHPDHIAGLLGISAHSLELRRQGILKRLGPTCGVDDRRQGEREHRGPVATDGSRDTRPADENGAPARKTLSTSWIIEMPLLVHVSLGRTAAGSARRRASGTRPSSRVTPARHKHRQRQVSAREPVSAPWPALAKRLTMSQPSRHTRYALTWSEIAILAYSVSGCCVSRRSASPSRCGEARHPRWPEVIPTASS